MVEKRLKLDSGTRIRDLEVLPLRCGVPENLAFPTASFVEEGFCVVRLVTDAGVVGVGEPSPYGGSLEYVVEQLRGPLLEHLRGESLAVAWERVKQVAADPVHVQAAKAGLSQAILDASGKLQDIPCRRLLAGPHAGAGNSVPAYASGGMLTDDQPLELLLEEATAARENGFKAWKFRPPIPRNLGHAERTRRPPPVDIPALLSISERIREKVGGEFDLMVDLGCRIPTVEEAVIVCDGFAELDFFMVEEPMPRNAGEYAALRRRTRARIAGGETLAAAESFEEWMEAGSFDIVQPDSNLAGMYDGMEVGRLVAASGLFLVPHNWSNGINNAANVNVALALGEAIAPMIEYSTVYNPLREFLVEAPLTPQRGLITVQEEPGLGVSLNPEAVRRYGVA